MADTPLLDTINIPADLRRLKADQLAQVADELRAGGAPETPDRAALRGAGRVVERLAVPPEDLGG